MDQSNFEHLQRTDKGYPPHPTTQSGPDSQTDRPQARNSASGCNAVRFLRRSTGFAVGTVDARSDRRAHPFSDDPKRCIRRTTTDCRGCRSSRAGCRFGRSGSSGFVAGFRRLRLSNCGPVRRVRSNVSSCNVDKSPSFLTLIYP